MKRGIPKPKQMNEAERLTTYFTLSKQKKGGIRPDDLRKQGCFRRRLKRLVSIDM